MKSSSAFQVSTSGMCFAARLRVPGVDVGDVLRSEAGQHAAWTKLDDRLHLHGPHRHHGAGPVDLAQHLESQLVLQAGHGAERFSGGVGEDGNRRRFDGQLVHHLAERRRRGRHQWRVRGQRDRQDERPPGSSGKREPLRVLHGCHLARQHELHVGVAVGHPQLAECGCLLTNAFDRRFVEADDGDHAARLLVRGLGHDATPFLYEQERSLPGDRSGGRERGDLAQAVTGRDAYVFESVALAPHLVGRPANRHHARLDDVGAVQVLDGALEAQPADRHLQDLLGPLERSTRRWIAVVQVLSHAGLLSSLAWEKQCDRAGELYTHVISVMPTSRGRLPTSGRNRTPPAARGRRS